MAPLFAHPARDPYPSKLMKNRAPHVFRWTERMNQAGFTDGEFPDPAPDFLPNDELPETLEPVLRYFFTDCGAGGGELLSARPARRIKSEDYRFVLE